MLMLMLMVLVLLLMLMLLLADVGVDVTVVVSGVDGVVDGGVGAAPQPGSHVHHGGTGAFGYQLEGGLPYARVNIGAHHHAPSIAIGLLVSVANLMM